MLEFDASIFGGELPVGLGIKEPEISDKVLLVIGRQSLGVWGRIGHRRIERRLRHETS